MNNDRIVYIDFWRCIVAVLEKWTVVLVGMSCGIVVAMGLTLALGEQDNIYKANASVYCVADGSYSQTAESAQMMKIYADVILSARVAERANGLMGNVYPDATSILQMITVEYEASNTYYNSVVIDIIAQSPHEQEAIDVSNAMAEAFSIEMAQILSNGSVQVLDSAKNTELDYEAEKQNLIYLAVGAVGGAVLMAAWIVLKEIFAINLNTVEDGTLFGKLEVIGVIPDFKK